MQACLARIDENVGILAALNIYNSKLVIYHQIIWHLSGGFGTDNRSTFRIPSIYCTHIVYLVIALQPQKRKTLN